MKKKSTLIITAIAVLTLSHLQPATAQSWAIGGNTVTKDTTLGTKNSFALKFITNNAERVRITSSGNVGIGTKTPGYLLDVAGRMRIRSGGGGGAGIWFMNAANKVDTALVGMKDDNNIGFYSRRVGWGLVMNTTTGNVYLPNGLYLKGTLTMHAPGNSNFFVGPNAGNTAVTGIYNTATGSNTLHSLTTGSNNTGNGFNALYSNTTGNSNTATGYYALYSNTTGYSNTANGVSALYDNSSGFSNTANGAFALYFNTTGAENTANGVSALQNNTTGYYNTANGFNALYSNTTGTNNTANGFNALYSNTTGTNNTANGISALQNNTTGYNNLANGYRALWNNTTGHDNTANGYQALYSNTEGIFNTANGAWALYSNTTGNPNTANGFNALFSNTTGGENTADGSSALYSNTEGYNNTAIGSLALNHNTTENGNTALGALAGYYANNGDNNTFIGAGADVGANGITNATALGHGATVSGSNAVIIGNSSVTTIGGYTNWSNISDGRVKKNIKNNVPGLAFINKLTPVTYNLDLEAADRIIQRPAPKTKDGKTIAPSQQEIAARQAKEQVLYTGFVAQEVEKAAKELNYDFSGVDAAKNDKDLYGLRYGDFVVPLVKAVQELSKKNDEKDTKITDLNTKIADLQKQIDELKGAKTSGTQTTDAAQSATTKLILSSASLDQNQPNPFSTGTTIRYSLPVGFRAARIIITDNTGKAIRQLPLNTAGTGTVNIDASTLTSGTYNYSLVVDGKVIESKKMIVAH